MNSFLPYTINRSEYLIICQGNACASKILSLFEAWSNAKLNRIEELESNGEKVTEDDEWIYNTIDSIHGRMLGDHGRNAVVSAVLLLESLGILRSKFKAETNRTKRYWLDHKRLKLYLDHLHADEVIAFLKSKAPQTLTERHRLKINDAWFTNKLCIVPKQTMHGLDLNDDLYIKESYKESEEEKESPYPLSEASGGSVEPAALIANQQGRSNEDTPPPTPSPQPPPKPRKNFTHPAAAMEERFSRDHSGGKTYHPAYSDMQHWGVEWVWDATKGNRLNGWSDEALKAATAQLRKTNQPAEIGDACRWLAIRVNAQRWSELDLLKPESQATAKPQAAKRNPENVTGEVKPGDMEELDLNFPLHKSFQRFLELAREVDGQVKYKNISRARIHFWVGGEGASQLTWCQFTQSDFLARMQRDVERLKGEAA